MCLCISVRLKTAPLDVRLCACMQFLLSLFFACVFFVGVVAVTAAALTVAVSAINARTHTHFHSTDRSITRFHTLMCCDYCLSCCYCCLRVVNGLLLSHACCCNANTYRIFCLRSLLSPLRQRLLIPPRVPPKRLIIFFFIFVNVKWKSRIF